jgi:hypothetical protein
MSFIRLSRKHLPILIAIICCAEILIYLWAAWTSTLPKGTFLGMDHEFIFDKCARLAGRVSSAIILLTMLMVGYYGLLKIYAEEAKRETFLVLLSLFTCNHLIHLLFVLLRFHSHGESISLAGPVHIGGIVHGIITFSSIIILPILLWRYQQLSRLIYASIVLYFLNTSSFIIKTFLGKVKPPEHPAYHNQLGIVLISLACLYILYSVYREFRQKANDPKEAHESHY